jgi:PleD family two-component response regulator
MVHTEGSTELGNRMHFFDTLEYKWSRMHRESGAISLLYIDIDYFQQYNEH